MRQSKEKKKNFCLLPLPLLRGFGTRTRRCCIVFFKLCHRHTGMDDVWVVYPITYGESFNGIFIWKFLDEIIHTQGGAIKRRNWFAVCVSRPLNLELLAATINNFSAFRCIAHRSVEERDTFLSGWRWWKRGWWWRWGRGREIWLGGCLLSRT